MEYAIRPQTAGGYASAKRGGNIRRQQSLEAFPLPPKTTSSIHNEQLQLTKSTPELNHTFRFPPVPTTPERPGRMQTPPPRPPIEQTVREVNTLIHGRAISPPAKLQPLKYDRPPSGLPFADFSTWDLHDEDAGSEDGEELILPHTGWPAPVRSIPREDPAGFPPNARRYLQDQEREKVLRETLRAEKAVVDAGFDFGFSDPHPGKKVELKASWQIDVAVSEVPKVEVQNATPIVEARSPESEDFPCKHPGMGVALPLRGTDSAISLDSKTMIGKKSQVLSDKSYHHFGPSPPSRSGEVTGKKGWSLTPAPDRGQEGLRERKNANDARLRRMSRGFSVGSDSMGSLSLEKGARRKRLGFWGKMKSTVSLRKKATAAAS